jgi:hypothetical protein
LRSWFAIDVIVISIDATLMLLEAVEQRRPEEGSLVRPLFAFVPL